MLLVLLAVFVVIAWSIVVVTPTCVSGCKAPGLPTSWRTGEHGLSVGEVLGSTHTLCADITSKTSKHPKGKLPAKPKAAALLFAEDELADHILAQSSSFPMLDVKKLRRQTQKVVLADSLTAWQDGKVSEAVIAKFVQKEAGMLTALESLDDVFCMF